MVDCDKLIKSLKREELEAFVETNRAIENRISYGMRSELVEQEPTTFLHWSNGSRRWFAAHPNSGWGKDIKKGNEINLDANQLIMPYSYETINKFAECLKELPLYACSFEAKKRGEVDEFEATFCWALKQMEKIKREEWQKKHK